MPALEPVTRSQIVAEARSWLDTRWQHQGRLKRVGVDCVGLAYAVGNAFARFGNPPPKLPPYERTATDNLMIHLCDEFLIRATPRAGAVVAIRIGDSTRHMGILADYHLGGLSLIHAYAIARKVVEHRIDEGWQSGIFAAFDFPGVVDG